VLTLQVTLRVIDGLLFFPPSVLHRTFTDKGRNRRKGRLIKSTIRHPVLTALRLPWSGESHVSIMLFCRTQHKSPPLHFHSFLLWSAPCQVFLLTVPWAQIFIALSPFVLILISFSLRKRWWNLSYGDCPVWKIIFNQHCLFVFQKKSNCVQKRLVYDFKHTSHLKRHKICQWGNKINYLILGQIIKDKLFEKVNILISKFFIANSRPRFFLLKNKNETYIIVYLFIYLFICRFRFFCF